MANELSDEDGRNACFGEATGKGVPQVVNPEYGSLAAFAGDVLPAENLLFAPQY